MHKNIIYSNISAKNFFHLFLAVTFAFVLFPAMARAENHSQDVKCESDCTEYNQRIKALEGVIDNYTHIYEKGGWENFPLGKTIRINEADQRIPILRRILSAMGDYKAPEEENASPEILDSNLVEAVKNFQKRHGLDVDGDIGRKTQVALAVPVEFRIAQMKATLERMKTMPELSKRYVLVNTAGFYLEAVDDNHIVVNSRIIVGKPNHATPLFHREITEISFNPQWHVPYSIARDEMMDKLREDPEYFIKGDYIIKDSDGETVDAETVDWENQSGEPYKFVQRSGIGNALGKIKFNLPDTNNIYLHSTGSPKLFEKSMRALSHGCIRVDKARELAYFITSVMEGWNPEKVDKLYDSNQSKVISVNPVDVHLVYWTSWVDEASGQPYFYADMYGRDKNRVAEILESIKNPLTVSTQQSDSTGKDYQ